MTYILTLRVDGQTSLWEAATATLDETPQVEIVDLLHTPPGTCGKPSTLFHAHGSEMSLKWKKLLVLGLLSGMGTGVSAGCDTWPSRAKLPAASRTRLEQIHDYFDCHRARIHDDQYLAAGDPVASGVIERACRHVVKDRMERAGIHWTLAGAQALLNLRCVALNDKWEPFMNHHIQSETACLYAQSPSNPNPPISAWSPERGRARLVAPDW